MLINTAALVYGAITDYRHRLISDLVPVTLIGTGIVKICHGAVWWPKVVAMLVVGTIVFVQIRPDDDNPPGGDFKLLSAMAFSDGLLTVLAVLLLYLSLCNLYPIPLLNPICPEVNMQVYLLVNLLLPTAVTFSSLRRCISTRTISNISLSMIAGWVPSA